MNIQTQTVITTQKGEVHKLYPEVHTDMATLVVAVGQFIDNQQLEEGSTWTACTTKGLVMLRPAVLKSATMELIAVNLNDTDDLDPVKLIQEIFYDFINV
jgi:hypothetical protein